MKKLGKLSINEKKIIKEEELLNIAGGSWATHYLVCNGGCWSGWIASSCATASSICASHLCGGSGNYTCS